VSTTLHVSDERCVVRIEGDSDINGSEELKSLLIEALSKGREFCLDMTQASNLDITAIQLCWAAARDARKQGMAVTVSGSLPDPLRRTVIDGGMPELLSSLGQKTD
jgi:anti-anti-sigma regulatory factor